MVKRNSTFLKPPFPLVGVLLWIGLFGEFLRQWCDLPVVPVTGHTEQYGPQSHWHVKRPREVKLEVWTTDHRPPPQDAQGFQCHSVVFFKKKGSKERKWITYLPTEGMWGGLVPLYPRLSWTGVDGMRTGASPWTRNPSPELYGTLDVTGFGPQTNMDQERDDTNCVDRRAWF